MDCCVKQTSFSIWNSIVWLNLYVLPSSLRKSWGNSYGYVIVGTVGRSIVHVTLNFNEFLSLCWSLFNTPVNVCCKHLFDAREKSVNRKTIKPFVDFVLQSFST